MTDYVKITSECGRMDGRIVAEGAIPWLQDRHAHAHQKGIDGLSAGGCRFDIRPAPIPDMAERDREIERLARQFPEPESGQMVAEQISNGCVLFRAADRQIELEP
jgi:hypothetical protein